MVPNLMGYFEFGIATCEYVKNSRMENATVPSILNAGWLIEKKSGQIATAKLNEILDKALSTLFIKKKWKALNHALVAGNSAKTVRP
jgi:hypothetical protein